MTPKRHLLKLNESTLRQIEYVLPKLKYATYIKEVTDWLENFEEADALSALDFLFYLEYITSSELQFRLEEQLIALNNHFGKSDKFLFCSYAQYPKSNDLVLYLLSKCPTYKRLENENKAGIANGLDETSLGKYTVVVFVDDIIGSGGSFIKWYKKEKVYNTLGQHSNINDQQALLAAIVMEDANNLLHLKHPDITIFAEKRSKAFCKTRSPFNLSANRSHLRSLALKYGINISKEPYGFSNAESLVSFEHGTPNNSLPIIWEDKKWHPIFPRFGGARINRAAKVKSEAAFYIGLMNKLEIQFDKNIHIKVEEENIMLSKRDDHSILVYLILKEKRFNELSICQIIGITLFELEKIQGKAMAKKLIDKPGELTKHGIEFLKILKKNKNIFQFREKTELTYDDQKIFVMKSFGKVT